MTKKTTTQPTAPEKKKAPVAAAAKTKKTAPEEAPSLIAPNTTFTLTLTIETLAAARNKAITQARGTMAGDGFRKGKMPIGLVEKRVNPEYLAELMLQEALSPAYKAYLEEHDLHPISEPEVMPKNMKEGEDWVFEVSIAQAPKIDISGYDAMLKAMNKPSLPELPKPPAETTDEDMVRFENLKKDQERQTYVQAVLGALLEKYPVAIPELLLRQETEKQLHHLSHQLEHLNVEFAQYLANIKKTQEELQQEYALRSLANLQIELLLSAIAQKADITVSTEELQALMAAAAEKREKKEVSREEASQMYASLLKQRVIDHLLSLVM